MTPHIIDGGAGRAFKHLTGVPFRVFLDPDAPVVRVVPGLDLRKPLPPGLTMRTLFDASVYHEGRLSRPDEINVWRRKSKWAEQAALWDMGRAEQ